jgi:hypothetical protein
MKEPCHRPDLVDREINGATANSGRYLVGYRGKIAHPTGRCESHATAQWAVCRIAGEDASEVLVDAGLGFDGGNAQNPVAVAVSQHRRRSMAGREQFGKVSIKVNERAGDVGEIADNLPGNVVRQSAHRAAVALEAEAGARRVVPEPLDGRRRRTQWSRGR